MFYTLAWLTVLVVAGVTILLTGFQSRESRIKAGVLSIFLLIVAQDVFYLAGKIGTEADFLSYEVDLHIKTYIALFAFFVFWAWPGVYKYVKKLRGRHDEPKR